MVEIEIDGKKVEVPEGSMVMHAADKAGTRGRAHVDGGRGRTGRHNEPGQLKNAGRQYWPGARNTSRLHPPL